jgi:hypothetical protein
MEEFVIGAMKKLKKVNKKQTVSSTAVVPAAAAKIDYRQPSDRR